MIDIYTFINKPLVGKIKAFGTELNEQGWNLHINLGYTNLCDSPIGPLRGVHCHVYACMPKQEYSEGITLHLPDINIFDGAFTLERLDILNFELEKAIDKHIEKYKNPCKVVNLTIEGAEK